ncbi:MAG: hypothetical protein DRP63_06770 [Planctomycetota bacterium]|nr:MAG: hypothetical protein DRP63_06770 [Planctomycetota bacterium]
MSKVERRKRLFDEIWKKMKARFQHLFKMQAEDYLPKLHRYIGGKNWCLNRPFVEIIPSATVLQGKRRGETTGNNLTT